MYGAVFATLRSEGTLNSPKFLCCASTWRVPTAVAREGSSLYLPSRLKALPLSFLMPSSRPESTRPFSMKKRMPVSANSPLVKFGPKWHVEQLPLRSEEHTSELQSQSNLVCRLLLEKKKMFSGLVIRLRSLRCLKVIGIV